MDSIRECTQVDSTSAVLMSLRIAMSALLGLSVPPSLALFATSSNAAPAGHSAPLKPSMTADASRLVMP